MRPLANLAVSELLRLHGDVLDELRSRHVLRSSNSPSGDSGELLFCRAFGWELRSNSSSGYDATDAAGVHYQIKCRRITPTNRSRQLSFIRNPPDLAFDGLAGVLLDQPYRVIRAVLASVELIQERATYVAHVNA